MRTQESPPHSDFTSRLKNHRPLPPSLSTPFNLREVSSGVEFGEAQQRYKHSVTTPVQQGRVWPSGRDGGAVATLGPPHLGLLRTPSIISRWPRGNGPGTRDNDVSTSTLSTLAFEAAFCGVYRSRSVVGMASLGATRQQPAPVGHSHRAACSDPIRSNHLTHTRDVVHEGNVHPRRRHTLTRTSPPQQTRPK